MPRRNRARRDPGRALSGAYGATRREPGGQNDWIVRIVPGDRASKTYRCPGCDHEIPPGVGHVVAWPADAMGDVADRRHWHQGCWAARDRRGPARRR